MNKVKNYVSAYNWENRKYFNFLSFESEVIAELENIINSLEGIFVLAGKRGSGKTSLINRAKENVKSDKNIIITVSRFTNNKAMLREILKQLEENLGTVFNNELENFNNLLKNFDEEHFEFRRRIGGVEKEGIKFEGNEWKFLQSKYIVISQAKKMFEDISNKFSGKVSGIDESKHIIEVLEKHLDNFTLFNSQYLGRYPRRDRFFRKQYTNIDEKYLKEKFKKIESNILKIKEKYEILTTLQDFIEQAGKRKVNFDLNIILETKNEFEIIEKTEKKKTVGIDLIKVVNVSSKHNKSDNKSTSDTKTEKTQQVESEEDKYYGLLQLLKVISPVVKITLIIDELDKSSREVLFNLLDTHKSLFLDSGLSTIFITDVYAALELQANRSSYIQESNTILVRSLDLYGFLRRRTYTRGFKEYSFIELLEFYYYSQGNNRKIVNMKNNRFSAILSFNFFAFQKTDFYYELSDLEKEIASDFIFELFKYLRIVERITYDDLDEFSSGFEKNNEIKSIYTRGLLKKIKNYLYKREFDSYFHWESDLIYKEKDYSIFSYDNQHIISKFLKQLVKKENLFAPINSKNIILEYKESLIYELELLNFMSDNKIEEKSFLKWLKWNAGLNPKAYCGNMKEKRFALEDEYHPEYGIDDAKRLILRYTDEIVGVILFYPYNEFENSNSYETPLINGFVVRKTNFGEVIYYPYLGYIGLDSHKPKHLIEFKEFMTKEKVKYYEITEEDIPMKEWGKCFKDDGDNQKEKIQDVTVKYLSQWTKNLDNLNRWR